MVVWSLVSGLERARDRFSTDLYLISHLWLQRILVQVCIFAFAIDKHCGSNGLFIACVANVSTAETVSPSSPVTEIEASELNSQTQTLNPTRYNP